MTILWQGLKVTFGLFLIVGLVFASAVFAVLLYAKATGQEPAWLAAEQAVPLTAPALTAAPEETAPPVQEMPSAAMLDAPIIKQLPELPAGCEITSLTMLLQFSGIAKNKLELAAEMPKDETPIVLESNGSIKFWGNPNTGFVGDVTRKQRGFGIYHTGLFPLLKAYIATAKDITNEPFEEYERQVAKGIPVIVWTTIDYSVPAKWVTWDTPIGPVQTTFAEHAVLLVGFDEQNVYINDPLSGLKQKPIDKAQFVESWKALGKQGLTYMNL